MGVTMLRLTVVADVSGSMYRFNWHDGRLQRSLEATLMLMEALAGYEDRIQACPSPSLTLSLSEGCRLQYRLVGHSGEDSEVDFGVSYGKSPKNEKERLDILKVCPSNFRSLSNDDDDVR